MPQLNPSAQESNESRSGPAATAAGTRSASPSCSTSAAWISCRRVCIDPKSPTRFFEAPSHGHERHKVVSHLDFPWAGDIEDPRVQLAIIHRRTIQGPDAPSALELEDEELGCRIAHTVFRSPTIDYRGRVVRLESQCETASSYKRFRWSSSLNGVGMGTLH